jgi:hypothetical protein
LLNSDAALFAAESCMGVSVVTRHHRGVCLVSYRQQLPGVLSPEEAEALALRRSVSLAQEEGFDRVVFASHNLSLIQRLKAEVMDRSSVGILVSGIKAMTSSFSSVLFIHVSRSLNIAAHTLAKSCISCRSSEVFHYVPDCIRGTLCIDISNQ